MIPSSACTQTFDTIGTLAKEQWARVSSPQFPFSDYDYFQALEKSGSVGAQSGWVPSYITEWEKGELQAASFIYTKDNSNGEYIFDWAWAEAYHRHRIPYFPKLLSAVPFTPATGPKLLFHPQADKEKCADRSIGRALQKMENEGQSSLHYLFITEAEVPFFKSRGFLIRHSFQYHWENRGYKSFDDFLNALKPRKRKQIARERAQLNAVGLEFRVLTGAQLTSEHAKLFYQLYLTTIRKMGAIPYLTPEFFSEVFATMSEKVILMLAEEKGTAIAGALYYQKGDSLFGRYWGAFKEVRNLHFELCYYLPLERAIQQKLRLFEAGAQGEHKISRGFLPELTYSAHWIVHPDFREAITRFIEEEKMGIRNFFEQVQEHQPYCAR